MKVKRFSNGFCSRNFFAALVGRSATLIYHLQKIGVVKYCKGGVLILQSLRGYFNSYLPPNIRRAEIDAAISRIDALLTVTDKENILNPARALKRKIDAQKFKIILLDFFRKTDARAVDSRRIYDAAQELCRLQQELLTVKENLRRMILAAEIKPRQIENILLYRYVDCLPYPQIADFSGYSLPHVFLLHRRGRSQLQTLAQD